MEFGENMFCLNNHIINRDQNGNTSSTNTSFATCWYSSSSSWEPPSTTNSSFTLFNNNAFHTAADTSISSAAAAATHHHHHPPLYGGDGSHLHPDPHLTCLKLGKRHYFEDTNNSNSSSHDANIASPLGERHESVAAVGELFAVEADKRVKGGGGEKTGMASVPRCQVEGCHVALVNSKEYHRRHKVCEMHSKSPKVVVLGREQRFCQQCSRFHVVSEFDESKRSCRRRLAGHNERRRKSAHHNHNHNHNHSSVARNSYSPQAGCARSLLSPGTDSWLSHADLSIRCSAALHELIAENRAALMTRQLVVDRDWHLHQNAVEEDSNKETHQPPESNYFPQQIFPQTQ